MDKPIKRKMRFHHIGIPITEHMPNEKYLEQYKFYVSGFDTSEFGIEWMRFEKDSPVDEIIQKVPHIAFEVDDLDNAIKGKQLIGKILTPFIIMIYFHILGTAKNRR